MVSRPTIRLCLPPTCPRRRTVCSRSDDFSRLVSRDLASLMPSAALRRRPRLHPAEPPLATLELADGFGEGGGVEVGPHPRGEPELGVGTLPEQEVAQPLLAAAAHQQVHVRRGLPRAHGRAEERLELAALDLAPRG